MWSNDGLEGEAAAWLALALAGFRADHPDTGITGLAVEISVGSGSPYLALRDARDGDGRICGLWRHTYAEQGSVPAPQPSWVEPYGALQTAYFRDGAVEWGVLERALADVVAAMASAVAAAARDGSLASAGLGPDAVLSVYTEDDRSADVGEDRVRAAG